MGKISKLLKWNRKVVLKDGNGKVLMDAWVRILDDDDLEEAYRDARLASATLRAELRDTESKRYLDDIKKIDGATQSEAIQLIKAARGSNLTAEAFSNVVRPDLPKLEQIAVDPDAPTLEEQEKLDAAITQLNKEYTDAIDEYIETRSREIDKELEAKDLQELIEEAKKSTIDLLSLSAFIQRVLDEKIWRGTYTNSQMTERGFDSFEDFYSTDSFIKEQLRDAYNSLELDPDEVKN